MEWRKFFRLKKEKRKCGLDYVNGFSMPFFTSNAGAMNLSTVFRCTELISDNIAMLPVRIQRKGENGKNEIDNHPLNLIFGDRFNGNVLTKFNLFKLIIQSVILRGNAFCYIERAEDGTVTALRYLEPNDVTINYNKFSQQLFYNATIPINGSYRSVRIEPCNMLHFLKNSYDGVNGISVLTYAFRSLGISNSTEDSARSFFDKGMNLGGILTVQGQLQEKQKNDIRHNWETAYGGQGQGLCVLSGNMNYQPLNINAKDAQMLESRNFNAQDLARFFGVNPILLGIVTSNVSNIEEIQNDFLLHTLQPYITMIENEMNRKLFKPSEKRLSIYLETNEIMRVNKNSQANYYSTMLKNGLMTINEIRKELGYSNIGKDGDKNIIPFTDLNMNKINSDNTNKDKNTNQHTEDEENL